MALFMRRALLIGVVYIIFFEGVLASFDTIARRMTVMYYFRVLVLRWLKPASGARMEARLEDRAELRRPACGSSLGAGLPSDHPRIADLCGPRVPHEDARGRVVPALYVSSPGAPGPSPTISRSLRALEVVAMPGRSR